ncbi:MAG: hypothetical protein V3W45_04640 [Sedimentisphaerales bacterium]
MIKQRTVGFIAFLKGSSKPSEQMPGCANYDHHYGGCLFGETCRVEQGQRCGYFEKAILPTAVDIGAGERMHFLYEKQCGLSVTLARGQMRICPDCGTELKPRQRYCDNCKGRRRQKSYRQAREKQRSKRNS